MTAITKLNYKGFIPPKPKPENYVLGDGNVPQVVLQENSDWTTSLPVEEKQNVNYETFNCVSFGTLSAIETMMFRLFGEKVNYSDRWIGIMAGTNAGTNGNDPDTICEAIKHYGLIPEEMLPMSGVDNIDEYYSFKGADKEACLKAGQEWLAKHDFKYEDVFKPNEPLEEKIKKIIVALKFSILGGSVEAWILDERGVYIRIGQENHWAVIYNQFQFTGIFDTYPPFLKKADQNFSWCKRFHIAKKNDTFLPEKETNWLIDLLKALGYAFIGALKLCWKKLNFKS